jgi:hypothetical protein
MVEQAAYFTMLVVQMARPPADFQLADNVIICIEQAVYK